jgi:hypothetical protein
LTETRQLLVVEHDAQIQAADERVLSQPNSEGHDTSNLDGSVIRQVEVKEVASFGKEFGESDGAFGGERRIAKEEAFEIGI